MMATQPSMAMKKRGPRRVDSQVNELIKFMNENQLFARGEFEGPNGKRLLDEKWLNISNILNELGPSKSEDQWRKLWRNLKADARKKNAQWSKWQSQTGNRTNTTAPSQPNDNERLILSIIGEETSTGLGVGEAGFGEAVCTEDVEIMYTNKESDDINDMEIIFENPLYTETTIVQDKKFVEESVPSVSTVPVPSVATPILSGKRVMQETNFAPKKQKSQPQIEQCMSLINTSNDKMENLNCTMIDLKTMLEAQMNRLNDNIEQFLQLKKM